MQPNQQQNTEPTQDPVAQPSSQPVVPQTQVISDQTATPTAQAYPQQQVNVVEHETPPQSGKSLLPINREKLA